MLGIGLPKTTKKNIFRGPGGQNRDFFFENDAAKLTYKYHYVYNIYIHNTPGYTFLIIKQKEK